MKFYPSIEVNYVVRNACTDNDSVDTSHRYARALTPSMIGILQTIASYPCQNTSQSYNLEENIDVK